MHDATRVDSILAEWLDRRERGEAVEPGALIRAHPELAAALRDRFAALHLVDLAFSEMPSPPADLPERIGPFRVVEMLGSGGMGSVYRATVVERDGRLAEGREVALKVVHPHLLRSRGAFKRFLREAELGRRVEHANVVRTLDADACDEGGRAIHYLVMEYVEGQTLRDLLADLDRVPEDLCRHVGREVAQGLAAIHAAGVVHRDLKPENVLITKEHEVKVMDLGVARQAAESVRLSQTGAFVGSIAYAAPEQFRGGGEEVDGRADLYALGVVLYELATGKQPFEGGDPGAVLRRVIEEVPRRCAELHPQLSPFFEEVVHTLLAKNRDERFPSAADVVAVLTEGERSPWWKTRAKEIRAATKRPLRRIRIPRETALYGREEELAVLHDLFVRAKEGDGRVLLVEGEAGIGKSRLVDEFVGLHQAGGEEVNFLFGGYPPGGAATASGAFSTAYREQFGDASCAAYLPETPLLVPAFDALLRGDGAPSGAEPLTKDSLKTVFVHATRALAAERPTIVLIEDLHFAPEEGRALFASLALAVPGHRVLLVGTARPGVPEKWTTQIDRLEHARRLPLPRLGPKDLVRLLRDAFRSEHLAHELAGRVAEKSDGNPFFVFEILRGLKEGQFLAQRPDGTWHTTQVLRDIHVPSSITDLVHARIADLDDDDRNLLEVASCQGFEFDAGLAAEVLGLARIPALQRLGRIEKRHRLVRSAGQRFVFDHHQVQESLHGGLSDPLRQEYHAATAEALERRHDAASRDPATLDGALSVALCDHFLRGVRGVAAVRHLDAATTHLTAGYLHEQVVELSERALAIPDALGGIERVEALLRLCDALSELGRSTREEEAACEAVRLADASADGPLQGRAARALGLVFLRTARLDEAESITRWCLEFARVRGDRSAEAGSMVNLALVLQAQGRLSEAREHGYRGLALCLAIGHRLFEANATGNLAQVLCLEGRTQAARHMAARSRELSREIGDRAAEARAMCVRGNIDFFDGRLDEALECYKRDLAICRAIGSRWGESVAAGNLGGVYAAFGRPAAAHVHDMRTLAISREVGDRAGEARALANLGCSLLEEGDVKGAEEHLLAALTVSEEIGDARCVADVHLVLGRLRAMSGEESPARESFTLSRDGAKTMGLTPLQILAHCHLACMPGGPVKEALTNFTADAGRLGAEDLREARFLLWKATGDRAHLVEAKRLLDEAVAQVDDETRTSMLTNVRLNREIAAAAAEHLAE